MEVEMTSSRKRDRQKSFQEFDSDDEQSEAGTVDSREMGSQRGKGHVRQNHSEIEKRRRDKMNTHIHELSTMIPMCSVMSRKLDKLTVLRMAVQHMRALKGEASSTESNCKPSFLSDEDFKNLILESADGFLFVVACDRGRILYVSDSVQNVISQPQSNLVGQSFFDLVHPKDVTIVKDQLSCFDMEPREKTAEKTSSSPKQENKMANNKPMCTGARRSFLCRMKIGSKTTKRGKGMEEGSADFCIMNRKSKTKALSANDKKKHIVVHFTGYLKSWPPSGYSFDDEDEDQDSRNLSCLVAVGRQVKVADENVDSGNPEFPNEFVSRHSTDGKFIHVDQRVTAMCGYLPHELLGDSGYDYFHPDDLDIIANSHKSTLLGKTNTTPPYRFLCKAGHYIYLCTKSTAFRNPWTKELEFIICVNTKYDQSKEQPSTPPTLSFQSNPHQRLILPAPSPKTVAPGADGTPGRRLSIRELMATIQPPPQEQVGKPNLKPGPMAQQATSDEDDPNADPTASKIGVLIAETVHLQEAANKRQHASIIGNSSIPNASLGSQSESSFQTSGSSSSMMDLTNMTTPMNVDTPHPQVGNMTSSFPGVTAPGLPEISQPHLLEQLIGMQQAIESMESPMQQSEESMAVFMNMLEADAGLGGDLSDFLFQENS